MAKLSVRDVDVAGKRVLMRVDFNVPLKEEGGAMRITDDTRIEESLPTIQWLLEHGAKVILMAHLGRPKGERVPKYSLRPVAEHLGGLIEAKVLFCESLTGPDAEHAAEAMQPGEVLLLENVRYDAREEKNDPSLAAEMAKLADVYVNDAFGAAHRAHASTAGVAALAPVAAMGLLMERELKYLVGELENPTRPFLVILGGAKVSDKIGVIKALLDKADVFLIGGAMAYTFFRAQGLQTGTSLVEEDKIDLAKELLDLAEAKNARFLVPLDNIEADEFKEGANVRPTKPGTGISEGWMGIDIGPLTVKLFSEEIAKAGTIVWNGPVGVFEIPEFARGTMAIAKAVADSSAISIIGGGDSVTAVKKAGEADRVSFISTGGGASLELLEGKELPGVGALSNA